MQGASMDDRPPPSPHTHTFLLTFLLHLFQTKRELPMHRNLLDWGMRMAPGGFADYQRVVSPSFYIEFRTVCARFWRPCYMLQTTLSVVCLILYPTVCFMRFHLVKLAVVYSDIVLKNVVAVLLFLFRTCEK